MNDKGRLKRMNDALDLIHKKNNSEEANKKRKKKKSWLERMLNGG
jgi:hypothetical protein